ncbi:hypothetical protein [Streptomyces pacificus]|uniref:Uncharacterized protein n=1 Tax=Streptomyces pacificus TaxID=2705029 RepID=A0A6A0AWG2_9ACTN|nr:hypothetical protein [Streptomyces pacificus]GFH37236.1 hypothetical protein SCWH03_34720 [Streptomyces pacificus]
MPSEVCGIPIEKTTLSSVLPEGRELKEEHDPLGWTEARCDIYVDKYHALDVVIKPADRSPSAQELSELTSQFTAREKLTDFPFAGHSVVGDQGALVVAECNSIAPYVTLNIKIDSERLNGGDGSVEGVRKFVEEFVPGVRDEIGCAQ